MRDQKKKGPAADQLAGPKAKVKTKAKHILKDRIKGEMTWAFIQWLKERRLYVVNADEVFCVPFSHLVRPADLK